MQPFEKELARTVRFLNRGDDQSQLLWDVLSALRGPDELTRTSGFQKNATTVVIRHAIGLKQSVVNAEVDSDGYYCREIRKEMTAEQPSHFRYHAKKAFLALGLAWRFENSSAQLDLSLPWYKRIFGAK